LIYNGEVGFDTRYASSGMWGIATYFAKNASYSNGYASTNGNDKQMFLARVLVGVTFFTSPNNALKKPPQKGKNALGFPEDYDSVSGETGNSVVYMVYENNHAYPDYLITYR